MARRIIARSALRDLAYSINQQLDNDTDPKIIYNSALKRLTNLRNSTFAAYTDWTRAKEQTHIKRKVKVKEEDAVDQIKKLWGEDDGD
jgi:hypothetical protein